MVFCLTGTEQWTPKSSNLCQLLVSIQGLILVAEPYYNEAGYEKQKGTQTGHENSRMYNEMVLLKLTQTLTKMGQQPPSTFRQEVLDHLKVAGPRFAARLEGWIKGEEEEGATAHDASFPLLPPSKGFCISMQKALKNFKSVINGHSTEETGSN